MIDKVGIAAIGIAIPSLAFKAEDLAAINGTSPDKYLEGLGIRRMGLCKPEENVSTLAVDAAIDALEAWQGDSSQIGFVAVGTETGDDHSKPLTQAICRQLELSGDIRSYEVKHACLGASLAIRQALEWILSGSASGKSALVVAADVCTYEPGSQSEATQGAGAIAFIIGEASLAEISLKSYSYSNPVDDFMRPLGHQYPVVNAALSHRSYLQAALSVFKRWQDDESHKGFDQIAAMAFHSPFPKMVKKTVFQVMSNLGLDKESVEILYQQKVEAHMDWNRDIGNSYTASLWFAVAHAIADPSIDNTITAFSYGSGCGAELMFLNVNQAVKPYWAVKMKSALEKVDVITKQEYKSLRQYCE